MSFRPVILGPGIAGWQFIQRTRNSQFQAFRRSSEIRSDADYFLDMAPGLVNADSLIGDRRALTVALGAFDLAADLNHRAFIRKVLEDGTTSEDALANRLTDTRYRKLSAAFGFGPGQVRATSDTAKMDAIVERYWNNAFQVAVGEQDNNMRIALYAGDALASIASGTGGDTARWFSAMGETPLRRLFERAFGLPPAFSRIDLDKQLEVFRDRTMGLTGESNFSQFADPARRTQLINRFLAMSQMAGTNQAQTPNAIALTLMQATMA